MHPYFLNFPQVLFNYVLNTARPNLPVGFDPSKWWVLDMAVQYAGEGAMKKLGKRIGLIEFEVSSECRGSDSPCRPPKRIPRPRSLHPRAKRTYDSIRTPRCLAAPVPLAPGARRSGPGPGPRARHGPALGIPRARAIMGHPEPRAPGPDGPGPRAWASDGLGPRAPGPAWPGPGKPRSPGPASGIPMDPYGSPGPGARAIPGPPSHDVPCRPPSPSEPMMAGGLAAHSGPCAPGAGGGPRSL